MQERVITVHPDGKVEFTREPTLLSLFEGQRASVKRMTDINFSEPLQRYYFQFIRGPKEYRGRNFCIILPDYPLFSHEGGGLLVSFQLHTELGGLITFDTYEDAVKAEIQFVEFLRELGYSMQ